MNPKILQRIGVVLSALPVLMLSVSATMKLTNQPEMVEGFAKIGLPAAVVVPIGALCLVCVLLYAIPPTAVLGALLLTGYLGGVVSVHVRVGEPFITPVLIGVIVWAGLYLRDPRVRALLPLRR